MKKTICTQTVATALLVAGFSMIGGCAAALPLAGAMMNGGMMFGAAGMGRGNNQAVAANEGGQSNPAMGRMLGESVGAEVGGDNNFVGSMVGGEVGARATDTPAN